jgi:tetraacyldisaccharide 4'-kinase
MIRAPSFWYPEGGKRSVTATLLWPLTLIWRLGAALRRMRAMAYTPETPTIAIGNITAGGTGKTPLVATLAAKAVKAGRHPIILASGYGGRIKGPYQVSVNDTASRVGDEARWLAAFAPVVVARDRAAGVRWIDENRKDCDLIIMDDGLQNPGIKPHRRIAVFSGRLGVGNGMLIPAGPLREKWGQVAQYDAIAITGDDRHDLTSGAGPFDLPVFKIRRRLHRGDVAAVKKQPVIAFAGIGDPDGFFDMLESAGIKVKARHPFADHHPFTADEIETLMKKAARSKARLVTTEKDMVRIDRAMAGDIKPMRLETVVDSSFMDILPGGK